jgi:chemotaxis protein MotA
MRGSESTRTMLVIVGALVVMICVFGGFALEGGHLAVLFQPIELLIIGGAGLGSLLISASPTLIKNMMHQVMGTLKGGEITQKQYIDLLMLLYDLIKTAKGNMLALEAHVEKPENSEIFKKYPSVLANHHAIHFIADTLKVQISSPVSPYDLEELMDTDLKSLHEEEHAAPELVQKTGDAMPGLGIVAAVLGVVLTMGKLTMGKEVIGHSVAAALVGTFIGILLSYGFFGPIASKMTLNNANAGKYLQVIKAALLAFAKNCSPKVCVEFARRTIPPAVRPDFETVDKASQGQKAA